MPQRRMLMLALLALTLSGCFSHTHTVGDGPRGGEVRVHRRWYALWGWAPTSSFDTSEVVGSAEDYRVITKFGVGDHFLNLFTAPFSFFRRTIIVEM